MSSTLRRQTANPKLGVYFGIFTSAFAAIVLLVLMLEQLGTSGRVLETTMLLGPGLLVCVIGLASRTSDPFEYFAAGRRVPSVYNGLVMALTAVGGTGIVTLTGAFFFNGFDAWCIATGLLAGFVAMGVLIAPFLRKFGGFTVATYVGRRFDSRLARIVAASLLCVPMILFLTAELSIAASAAAWLTGYPQQMALSLLGMLVLATVIVGGMRSLTWSATAQSIAVLLAITVPAGLLAVLAGNLPVPQLSHGPTLRSIVRLENIQAIALPIMDTWSFYLAGPELTPLAQRFSHPFGAVGPGGYIGMALTIMAGVASAPWILPRTGTTISVYETRKSAGWATFTVGVLMLTISAIAVFMRDLAMDNLVGKTAAQLPDWFETLRVAELASLQGSPERYPMSAFGFKRDSILFILPIAADFPAVIQQLALAGAIMAALAGAAAVAVAAANTIAEDIIGGMRWEPFAPRLRLALARSALLAVVVGGVLIASATRADPLRLLLWAFAVSGSTAFPVLVLSIWWKRIEVRGALIGMVTGFFVSVMVILLNLGGLIPLDGVLAAVLAIPVATAAAMAASVTIGIASRPSVEMINDVRIPGGETIYDREARLLRLKQRKTP